MKNETVTTMSQKSKALINTIAVLILSVAFMVTVHWLVELISSSIIATAIAIFIWGIVIYKLCVAYENVQKVLE
jgi:ABC-type polysaccharide/polyol phosphate export permease